jgi:hypothetical protein
MTRREELLKQRPRSGPDYERARGSAMVSLVHLRGMLTDEQINEEAERLLDISWLCSIGAITESQLRHETDELAKLALARVRGRVGST